MKNFKKINKGLVLTIIVLLALTIYLIGVEKQRKADKSEIEKVCGEFIEITDKYLIYPDEMQILGQQLTKQQKDEYSKKMKNELEKIMIKNNEVVKIQYDYLENMLEQSYSSKEIRSSSNRKIIKVSSYEFDGNQVVVQLKTKLEINTKYLNGDEEKIRQEQYDVSNDEITLQKVDNEWKMVSSNLQYYLHNNYYQDSMMMY